MERGWFEVTTKLVKECRARDFKVASPVYKAKSNLNKQLNVVTNLLSGPSAVISPAFQWSQSRDYILLNVKFAHKLDTPATLGVKSKGADITNNGIIFQAASKSKNKRFKLALHFAREIVPEESEWSMAAVGRATFSLKKRHPETAWIKLLHPNQPVPQNMHTWWAMKEQHENDVRSLDTSLTDEAAIRKAEQERLENNETLPEATEIASTPESAASATPTPTEAVSTDESVTEANPQAAEYQKKMDSLLEEQAKAREKILQFSSSKSKEIESKLMKEIELEKTKIQREKVKALQNMNEQYEMKLKALGEKTEL
jgi:hypothetical protein